MSNSHNNLSLPLGTIERADKRDYSEAVRRDDYTVFPTSFPSAKRFIEKWHYAHGMMNGPTLCIGLFRDIDWQTKKGIMVGALAFATPCSERVRASVFGTDHKAHVTELHRLVLLDEVPHNAESFMIGASLRWLKKLRPDLWAVLSFSETERGHTGGIYAASNAFWCGWADGSRMYLDETGRRRHKRQCGKNIKREEARALGWQEVISGRKARYLFTQPESRTHRRWMEEHVRLSPQFPCPKIDASMASIAREKGI